MRRSPGLGSFSMTDADEVQLGKLAKRMLAMPPKKREDSKLGKPRNPFQKQKERPARMLSAGDPTIRSLRLALDDHCAAASESGEGVSKGLVGVILNCLPLDICNCIFLPAGGARGPHLAITFK